MFQFAAKFMSDGGIFMWVILGMWAVGLAVAFERWNRYRTYNVDGASLMATIRKFVIGNEISAAIQACSESNALLSLVMKNGLKRANQSKDQVQDALEATILEVVPKIEQRLPTIALMANVSTLFGLLGTIQGLIQSFQAVANAQAAEKAQLLAMGISVAMNTTAMGLLSAISLMMLHAYIAAKGERMIKEIEENSVKLVDLLGTKKAYKQDHQDAA
ncbi:MAG: MotA/TolQ/ExbB proton channel family protein [Bacteriovoracaceae bacterium]|nr:MotA/TolQ/ExbB proton channel family protein [Bacteriovoracaceae bacterium]